MRYLNGYIIAVFFLFVLFPKTGLSQEWNDAQKKIWSNVQTYWSLDDQMDLNGFSQYFDDSYKGWSYDSEKPMNKTEVVKEIKSEYDKRKDSTIKTKLSPLAIWVDGDMAFVHYTYTRNITSKDGATESRSGRWTDILKKKGDKWVLVGDHGGNIQNK